MTLRTGDRPRDLMTDPVFRAAQVVLLFRVVLVVWVLDPLSQDIFGVPKSVAGHVCAAVLAVLLLWLSLRHGRRLLRWSPIHLGVGLVVLSFAVATVFALDHEVALFGAWRRYLGLTELIDEAILYLSVVLLVRSRQALVAVGATCLLVVIGVLAYGAIQLVGLEPVHFAQSTRSQPVSTLGNPDTLSGFLSIASATAIAAAMLYWRQATPAVRAVALAVAFGAGMLLLTTGTRNSVLGLGAGLAATLALALLRPGSKRTLLLWLGAVCVLSTVLFTTSSIGGRLSPTFLQSDRSVQGRLEIWGSAIAQLQARPLFGVGPDNFGVAWFSTRSPSTEQSRGPNNVEDSTHGWPFYYVTSAGLVGLAAFLLAIILACVAALRLARRGDITALAIVPLAAYLGQGLVDINDQSIDWIVWFALGLLAGATAAAVTAAPPRRSKRAVRLTIPTIPEWVGWALVAVALVAALALELPRLSASRAEFRADVLLAAGLQRDAVAPTTESVQEDPRRAEYWSNLGAALAGVNGSAATAAFLTAAQEAPWHPLHWINVAIAERAIGNTGGALSAARRAVSADPNSAEAHRLLASVLLDETSYEQAATEGETALQLYAGPQMYEEPILAYIKLERWDRALALAQRAVAQTNSVHYHLRLAQALTGASRIAEARAELELVLRATPNDPEALALGSFLASQR